MSHRSSIRKNLQFGSLQYYGANNDIRFRVQAHSAAQQPHSQDQHRVPWQQQCRQHLLQVRLLRSGKPVSGGLQRDVLPSQLLHRAGGQVVALNYVDRELLSHADNDLASAHGRVVKRCSTFKSWLPRFYARSRCIVLHRLWVSRFKWRYKMKNLKIVCSARRAGRIGWVDFW